MTATEREIRGYTVIGRDGWPDRWAVSTTEYGAWYRSITGLRHLSESEQQAAIREAEASGYRCVLGTLRWSPVTDGGAS